MSTIAEYFEQAELAIAAYADLSSGMPNADYIANLKTAGMPQTQSQNFAATWRVVKPFNDPSGLSVTIFEPTAGGDQVVAIRGTQDPADWATDIIDIGILGTSEHQAQYAALSAQVQQWLDNGVLQSGFTVTGHSLGGFLATNLTLDYAADVTHTYIYNAPGVTGVGGNILEAIANALSPGNPVTIPDVLSISNIVATRDPASEVGLSISPPITVQIESNINPIHNHRMVTLTDALAVYDLFAKVDESVSVETINSIIEAASNENANTLDSALSALGAIYGKSYAVTDADDETARNTFYEHLYELQGEIDTNHGTVVSLVGQNRNQLAGLANSDIAYRYALEELIPFAVTGNNALFSSHNTDGHLDADQFTDQYLLDRADLLNWKMQFDGPGQDADDLLSGDKSYSSDWDTWDVTDDWQFTDTGRKLTLTIDGVGGDTHHIAFGADSADTLSGAAVSDHLYGMAGNDTLTGNGGNDYLEGGKGQDILDGGAGDDTFYVGGEDSDYDTFQGGADHDRIIGGAGDDTIRVTSLTAANSIEEIDGGDGENYIKGTDKADVIDLTGIAVQHIAGINGGTGADVLTGTAGDDVLYGGNDSDADILNGGAGSDTYYVGDNDVINDPDGTGTISYQGQNVADLTFEFLYADAGGEYYRETASGKTIKYDPTNSRLTGLFSINNFHNSDFGISLTKTSPNPPTPTRTLTGTADDDITGALVFQNVGRYYFSGTVSGSQPSFDLYPGWGEFLLTDTTPPDLSIDGGDGNDDLRGLAGSDNIDGGSGNDIINGEFEWTSDDPEEYSLLNPWGDTGKADVLQGGGGNDLINGAYGDDLVSGGDGNDFIDGGPGNDSLDGDAGSDVIAGSTGNDLLLGGDGNDLIYGDGAITTGEITPASLASFYIQMKFAAKGYPTSVTLMNFGVLNNAPEAGSNTLFGGDGNDLIFGGAGADHLYGETGHDTLTGGDGDDSLDGGDGNDWLIGDNGYDTSSGNDTLLGGAGDDILTGNGGNDTLDGGAGNDTLGGGVGDDILTGGAGTDYLYGEDGNDSLAGGDDNDYLDGGNGNDTLDGGAGNDTLYAYGGDDSLAGGDGDDTLHGGTGDDALAGGAGADYLFGDDGNDSLAGGEGNDRLYGDSGEDILRGGAGDDILVGGIDNDLYLFGRGDGKDTIYETDGDADTVRFTNITADDVTVTRNQHDIILTANDSDDTLTLTGWFDNSTGTRVERLEFSDGTIWDQSALEGMITVAPGTDGADILYGWRGNDTLEGGAGQDSLYGDDGDDTLSGGADNDTLDGGSGNDLYLFGRGDGQDTIYETDGDADTVRFTDITANDVTVTRNACDITLTVKNSNDSLTFARWFISLENRVERFEFSDGTVWDQAALENAITVAPGTDGADTLYGGGSDDTIAGGAGDDVIDGWRGNDTLNGGAGQDYLYGDDGDDTLDGGTGNDILDGGSGNDLYLFGRGNGKDTVYETAGDADTIRFTDIASTEVTVNRDQHDIILSVNDSDDSLVLAGWFDSAGAKVERLEFSDGTVWDQAALEGAITVAAATTGDDTLYAGNGGATLDGGEGDDTLYGGTGDDTYVLMPGSGSDTIPYDPGGYDTVELRVAYQPNAVTLYKSGNSMIARLNDGSQLFFSNWFDGSTYPIERFAFADGTSVTTLWMLEYFAMQGIGTNGNDRVYGYDGTDSLYGGTGDDTLYGGKGNDNLYGGEGDDTLYGGKDNDNLDGGDGNDTLYGGEGAGNDTLDGGEGNDYLYGGDGKDTYVFDRGDYRAWIDDTTQDADGNLWQDDHLASRWGDTDTITFGEGITQDDLQITWDGKTWDGTYLNLAIDPNHNDMLTVVGNNGDPGNSVGIELLKFADGKTLRVAGLLDRLMTGTAGNDVLYGSASADTYIMDGHEGDDVLHGTAGGERLYGGEGTGNDTLDGGGGYDNLYGGDGNDTYVFKRGYYFAFVDDGSLDADDYMGRNSKLASRPGDTDTIAFGPDITPSDLQITWDGETWDGTYLNLAIDPNHNDMLTILAHHGAFSRPVGIERLQFADGETLMVTDLLDRLMTGTAGDDELYGSISATIHTMHGLDGNDDLIGFDGDETMYGDDGNDALDGEGGNDLLYGGDGDDGLCGGDGDDLLIGGTGNDGLDGGGGADTYLFNIGDGTDTISNYDWYGTSMDDDTIALGTGISLADLELFKSNADLVMKIGNNGDQITFANWYEGFDWLEPGRIVYPSQVGHFSFADGTTMTADELFAARPVQIIPITGGDGDDNLYGTPGPDLIYGEGGNDSLTGGPGNDTLVGGDGSDWYYYNPGDGADIIDNHDATGVDTLYFTSDVTVDDLTLFQSDNDLLIQIGENGDQITVSNWFAGSAYQIDQFSFYLGFANVITLSAAELLAQRPVSTLGEKLAGTDADDVLTGGTGADTIDAGPGADTLAGGPGVDILIGGPGDDTYLFNLGDGVDTINDSALPGEGNTLVFGDGIDTGSLSLGLGSLLIRIGDGGDAIHLENFDPNDIYGAHAIDTFRFADGTTLSYQELLAMGFDLTGTSDDDNITGTNGVDRISGLDGNDALAGGAGDDELTGGDGNDLLDGGQGDDTLLGGAGDDRYFFRQGDGTDRIEDSLGANTLVLAYGISQADLAAHLEGNDLRLTIAGNDDTVVLADWFLATDGEGVNTIAFADGTQLDRAGMAALLNQPPTANPDTLTVAEDGGPLTLPASQLTANDTDPDPGDLLTVTAVGASQLGAAVTLTDGQITYDIGAGFQELAEGEVLVDSFTYTISDASGEEATSLVEVSIVGTNDAPLTAADTGLVAEDGTLTSAGNVLANDTDIDAGTVLTVANPGEYVGQYGTLTLAQDGSYTYALANDSAAVQALAQDQVVTDRFDYEATDGLATTAGALEVTVTGINDAPLTAADTGLVTEDGTLTSAGNVLANDTDVDAGTVLTVANPGEYVGQYGTLTLAQDGSYTYALANDSAAVQALAQDQVATDRFDYTATDGLAEVSSHLEITVTGINDAPLTAADTGLVAEDGTLTSAGNVLANDTDIDAGTVLTVANPGEYSGQYGTLTLAQDGSYSYALANDSEAVQALAQDQVATDRFDYTATDGLAEVSSHLEITVTGINDAPLTAADTGLVAEDGTLTSAGNVLANDSDVDTGTVLTVANPGEYVGQYGTFTLAQDGSHTYALANDSEAVQALAQDQVVTDRFDYTATDGLATTAGTLEITVTGSNDAPTAAPDTAFLTEDLLTAATGNVLANDSDVDTGTVLSVAAPGEYSGQYGTLTLAQDGSYTYALANDSEAIQALGRDQEVSELFTYTATDGITEVAADLTVTVTGSNDAPEVAAPLADQQLCCNKSFSWQLPAASFIDPDQGDTLSYTATLADGSALPDWLAFDPATLTFSGRAPKHPEDLDVQVTATDAVAVTGSTEGSLTAADVFQIAVGHGNEGVGNGQDAPPPGHHDNHNDGPGTAPGCPGGQAGSHGQHGETGSDHRSGNGARGGDDTPDHQPNSDRTDRQGTDDQHGTHRRNAEPAYLNASHWDNDQTTGKGAHVDPAVTFSRWLDTDLAVAETLAGRPASTWEDQRLGTDDAALAALAKGDHPSADRSGCRDAFSLAAGSGLALRSFRGLTEGLREIA